MKLMLSVIFLWIAIGLFSPRLGRRESIAVGALAVVMAGLYYLSGRFL